MRISQWVGGGGGVNVMKQRSEHEVESKWRHSKCLSSSLGPEDAAWLNTTELNRWIVQ